MSLNVYNFLSQKLSNFQTKTDLHKTVLALPPLLLPLLLLLPLMMMVAVSSLGLCHPPRSSVVARQLQRFHADASRHKHGGAGGRGKQKKKFKSKPI